MTSLVVETLTLVLAAVVGWFGFWQSEKQRLPDGVSFALAVFAAAAVWTLWYRFGP